MTGGAARRRAGSADRRRTRLENGARPRRRNSADHRRPVRGSLEKALTTDIRSTVNGT
jgi:hypothetical protein